jgi:hypothetical protein
VGYLAKTIWVRDEEREAWETADLAAVPADSAPGLAAPESTPALLARGELMMAESPAAATECLNRALRADAAKLQAANQELQTEKTERQRTEAEKAVTAAAKHGAHGLEELLKQSLRTG